MNRTWRTVKELTEELRFPSVRACRAWLHRQRIPGLRRGRVILVDPLDVEQALRGTARRRLIGRQSESRPDSTVTEISSGVR